MTILTVALVQEIDHGSVDANLAMIETRVAEAAARGARLVSLGRRTLRADAAPVAAISVLQFLWGDL